MKATNFRGEILQEVMPQKIDVIDQKVLYLLSKNCRTSNTALAKALKTKREVIAYRVNQLINKKLITGFFTLLDCRKLGFQTFSVYLKLRSTVESDEIVKELMSHPEVAVVSACSGRYDLFFETIVKTPEEFERILNDFLKKYSYMVREQVILNFLREEHTGYEIIFGSTNITNNLVLEEVKGSTFNKAFFLQDNNYVKSPKEESFGLKLDNIDENLLSNLKLNSRATLKEIAESAGITSNAAKFRVSRLVSSGVIKCFIPLISFSALGYQWFMILLNLSGVSENRLYTYAKQHPNIAWCVKYIGPWNYQLSVFAKDNIEFNRVSNEIRDEFKEDITAFDSVILFNQFKFEQRVR